LAQNYRVEPIWIGADVALAVHDRQLSEHGGPSGVRN
jgi:death-on-curing protein